MSSKPTWITLREWEERMGRKREGTGRERREGKGRRKQASKRKAGRGNKERKCVLVRNGGWLGLLRRGVATVIILPSELTCANDTAWMTRPVSCPWIKSLLRPMPTVLHACESHAFQDQTSPYTAPSCPD